VVTEEAVRVVAEYWDTRLVNAVVSVFNGNLNNLNILITGDSGVGKTTYAYYGLKVGYLKYIIKDRCGKPEYSDAYCVEKLVNEDVKDEASRWGRTPTRDELASIRAKFLRERLYDALEEIEFSYGSLCFGPNCKARRR